MTTYAEFINAYGYDNEKFTEMKLCSVCGETNVSFIDASNPFQVQFHCHKHWLENNNKEINSHNRE